jgi:hypothetical protein
MSEGKTHHDINAKVSEQLMLLVRRLQQRRSGLGGQQALGVRVERKHHGSPLLLSSPVHDLSQNGLVAHMNSVKSPYGQDRVAGSRRELVEPLND